MRSTKSKIPIPTKVRPINKVSDGSRRSTSDWKPEGQDQGPTEELDHKKTPIQIFAERVSIAGLEEAFSPERTKAIQIMFRVSLLISVAVINWQAHEIAQRYKKEKSAFNGGFVPDQYCPFPNVTICFAGSMNEEELRKRMIIPSKAARLMALYNFTTDDIMRHIKNLMSFNVDPDQMGSPIQIIAVTVADATIAHSNSPEEAMKIMAPYCERMLVNCKSDGVPFSCCQTVQFMSVAREGCFQISLDRLNQSSDSPPNQTSELYFEVHMDDGSLLKQSDASDGFYVFINDLPAEGASPTFIPAGAESLISISEPRFTTAAQGCVSQDALPQLKHFTYYDPNGIYCQVDEGIDVIQYKALGCAITALDYFPTNESCSLQMVFLLSLMATGNGIEKLWKDISNQKGDFQAMEKEMIEKAKAFMHSDKCQPICSRWIYHVHSASFNPKMNANYVMHWDDIETNVLLSQIRIFMPRSFDVWMEEEQSVSSGYVIICDIGGMIGVYAGMSMITFAQILAYGGYTIWAYWKARAGLVHPAAAL